MSKSTVDVIERTAATFLMAWLSVFVVSDLSTWHDVQIAAAAAALSALKSTAVNFVKK